MVSDRRSVIGLTMWIRLINRRVGTAHHNFRRKP
jgi:hypothetical protein